MWRPRSFSDVQQALGVLSETATLDFKRELGSGSVVRDVAKDAAAMSVHGGVIVVGVDETTGALADQIVPVPLSGTPERIQQVIDARVSPPLVVEIEALPQSSGATGGVVVVSVPPSLNAPHQFDDRYPARAGATTRWLSEPEIEALYARRRELASAPQGAGGLGDFTPPPGITGVGRGGIGRMRVLVRPLIRASHSATPRLRGALTAAHAAAVDRAADLIAPSMDPDALDFLREWRPRGSLGWSAGMASDDFNAMRCGVLVAGTYVYNGAFSFFITIPLISDQRQWRCAYEHLWATQLFAVLSLSAAFYEPVPEASLLRIDLDLMGLENAKSYEATHGEIDSPSAPVVQDSVYTAGDLFGTSELTADARVAVRTVLDPLFISFVSEVTTWLIE